MRRDQIHKICANHLLKSDMDLTWLKNSDRALVWVANDFAEEVVQIEKFCIKFKTPEEASRFRDIFNDAKTKYGQSPQKPKGNLEKSKDDKETKQPEKTQATVKENKKQDVSGKVNLGGFTFTSPPKLTEPLSEKLKQVEDTKKEPQPSPSPFASFTFTPQKPATTLSSATSLFAGLNNTQNKHNLFDDLNSDTYEDSGPVITNEEPRKPILKQPILTNLPPTTQGGAAVSQPKTVFNFATQTSLASSTPKETPKSILKEAPVTNVVTPVSNAKSSLSTKHVLFQDTTAVTPSQQTPTLSALLTSPKAPVVDFAALSKMNENKAMPFGVENKPKGFEGAGTPVFGGRSTNRPRTDSEGEPAEDFVPSAEFKPVIPLPELVEVKTGEEGQEVLFNERAKLMRFDPDTKEWKERGLGQMKILKDPVNGITRFLMRREQVYKVCCNHRIIQSLELRPSPSSEKAWTWYAVDYSEGEMKNELFAIRFKTVELAKQFKETVDNVQKLLREESTSKRSCPDSSPQAANTTSNKPTQESDTLPKLSELYRPKAGSWECKACYTVNGAKDNLCVCCDSPKEKPKSPGPSTPKTPEKTTTAAAAPSLAEMFKPKAGSWECSGCLVRNEADKTICPACSTPKPGHENDAKQSPTSGATFGSTSFSFGIKPDENKGTGFSFGIQPESLPKSSFSFGITPTENTAQESTQSFVPVKPSEFVSKPQATTGFSFGIATNSTKPSSPFTFAPKNEVVSTSADSTTSSSTSEVKESTPFKFGSLFGKTETSSSKASFMFGGSSLASESEGATPFGGAGKYEFSFSGVKPCKSPGSQSGGKSPRSPGSSHGQESDSENEEVDEEEGDHIIFQPVVPLPDKVPLTTGEEEEEVLYSHRAKLYRFAQGEWKERGVGDIKILRHNQTHKIRLLMRREPILKICLNHYLMAEMVFSPKDDRSWLWSAQDFADGQLTTEQFCLRLKTVEIAAEFKAAIDSAQGELEASICETRPASEDENDVEIVYVASVPEDLRQKALALKLPPNFYSYLNAPPCPGCRGCEPDSEEDESSKKSSTVAVSASLSESATTASTTVTSQPTTVISQPLVFTVKTTASEVKPTADPAPAPPPVFQPFSFSVKTTTTTPSSVSLFSTPSSQPAITTSSSSFTFSLDSTNTGSTLFGNAGVQTNSVFSSPSLSQNQTFQKSLFGNSTTTPNSFSFDSPKPSIFGGGDNTESPQSVFGTPSAGDVSTEKGSPFFANLNSSQTSSQSGGTLFGTPSAQSLFGGNSLSGGLFNSLNANATTDSGPSFLFKNTTTFSDIAANTTKPAFGTDSDKTNFSWVGAGSTVFGGKKAQVQLKAKGEDSGGEGEESGGEEAEPDNNHDPVFEPIVPLPDAIEVRTGEEDEDKEFCQRAKLYRYDSDTKEWKERGVGEMKILRHREKNTYRFLLRRDQVHKVVCNQLIIPELELQSLAGSDKSYCWAGMNMAEEYTEPRLEKLAVRFKNSDIAQEFKARVDECVARIKAHKENSVVEEDHTLEPFVTIEEVGTEYSEGSGDYCEGDYPEDMEPLFEKRATLYVQHPGEGWTKIGQGELRFFYNNEISMGNITFKRDNEEAMMISASPSSNVQELSDKEVTWYGQDYDMDVSQAVDLQKYKAEFCTKQAASEFFEIFRELMELAQTYESSYLDSEGED